MKVPAKTAIAKEKMTATTREWQPDRLADRNVKD